MVAEPKIFEYLGDGESMSEGAPFEKLETDRQMNTYHYEGFGVQWITFMIGTI